jgi:glycosyltransferase involved in cell wall biosynthesis
MSPLHPISVAVLIDLELNPQAGGHVKCWERFAEAACNFEEQIDLTIFFLGNAKQEIQIAGNVRYHLLPPVFSTERLGILRQRANKTDIAPYHWQLGRYLSGFDLLHATDTFTFAKTAKAIAHRQRLPLVSSIHTDLPKLTQVYSREIFTRLASRCGLLERGLRWLLLDGFKLDQYLARDAQRQVRQFMQASDRVLISKPEDQQWLKHLISEQHISRLRRGIDKQRFNPQHRQPEKLRQQFGILADDPILLFVGRLDSSKKVMTLARAARQLLNEQHRLHVLAIGEGAEKESLQHLLGPHITLPGNIPQDQLGWIYASADLFVFPSESEVSPNVVLEAKAAGLPVVISARDGGAQYVHCSGKDGILVADADPATWAQSLISLLRDGDYRRSMGLQAHQAVATDWPSWADVFAEDLLPIWQSAIAARMSTKTYWGANT